VYWPSDVVVGESPEPDPVSNDAGVAMLDELEPDASWLA
jgi:hypothetical protein